MNSVYNKPVKLADVLWKYYKNYFLGLTALLSLVLFPISILTEGQSNPGSVFIISGSISAGLFAVSALVRVMFIKNRHPDNEVGPHLREPQWYLPTIALCLVLGMVVGTYVTGDTFLTDLVNESFISSEGGGFLLFIFFPIILFVLVPWLPFFEDHIKDMKTNPTPKKLLVFFLFVMYLIVLFYAFMKWSPSINKFIETFTSIDARVTKFLMGSIVLGWFYLIMRDLPAQKLQADNQMRKTSSGQENVASRSVESGESGSG